MLRRVEPERDRRPREAAAPQRTAQKAGTARIVGRQLHELCVDARRQGIATFEVDEQQTGVRMQQQVAERIKEEVALKIAHPQLRMPGEWLHADKRRGRTAMRDVDSKRGGYGVQGG